MSLLNEQRIAEAELSLKEVLHLERLKGKRFLDVGSGSGLFSLAARRLSATVQSFDYDPTSVACAEALKRRFYPDDEDWSVEHGSVLDKGYMKSLGSFDVVYAWGVLHHTGAMFRAFENIDLPVAPSGILVLAIYNDQGSASVYWRMVKRAYNASSIARLLLTLFHMPYLVLGPKIVRSLKGRPGPRRGMSFWYDMKDWLGGYPFEVAKPEAVIGFFQARGYRLKRLKTCGGRHGCNEYVFVKDSCCR